MRRARVAATTLAVAAAACSQGGDTPSSPAGNRGGGPAGSVSLGSGIRFVSGHNGSANPAVDTIAVGETVTWTWRGGSHSVRSIGTPSFPSSDTRNGAGSYAATFMTPGTFRYDCAVHGQAMTGTIVVLDAEATLSRTVDDPVGDVFGTGGTQWDLTALAVEHDVGGITARLDFTADVLSPMSGDTSAIIGVLELDLDQREASGGESVLDHFRHDGGAAGMGVDATVDLSLYAADSSVAVYDTLVNVVGRVKPVFSGHSITIRIPAAMVGNDDGLLYAAVIIGSTKGPTDFAPQSGHLVLGDDPLVAPTVIAAARRQHTAAPPWRSR